MRGAKAIGEDGTPPALSPSALPEALRASFFDPRTHPHALTRWALAALTANDPATAFAIADRRCRVQPRPDVTDHLLRAEIALRLQLPALARADLDRALEIDPTQVLACLLALKILEGDTPEPAARTIIASGTAQPDELATAAAWLVGRGETLVGHLEEAAGTLLGWMTWRLGTTLHCRVTGPGVFATFTLGADPHHPLARRGRAAACCRIERPDDCPVRVAFSLAGEEEGWTRSFPARRAGRWAQADAPTLACDLAVIVPAYEDAARTRACLDSLAAQVLPGRSWRTIVVDDASPNPALVADLTARAQRGEIHLVRNAQNQGFAAAVNRGAALVRDADLLLLNADTLLPPRTLERLLEAAARIPRAGTVVPISNSGELTSFPCPNRSNPLPSEADLLAWDRAAAALDLPPQDLINGTAFCMLVTRGCWEAVGGLSLAFGRGYYEDVDLCLRARAAGYRNLCAMNLVVGHAGSRSFAQEKRALVMRNLARLEARHPGYEVESAAFVQADPLRAGFARLEGAIPPAPHSRLVVTTLHGAHPTVVHRLHALAAAGERVLLATSTAAQQGAVRLLSAADDVPQSLRFDLAYPPDARALAPYLRRAALSRIELIEPHRCPSDLLAILLDLELPLDLVVSQPWPGLSPALGAPDAAGEPATTDRLQRLLACAARILGSDAMADTYARRSLPRSALVRLVQRAPPPAPMRDWPRQGPLAILSPMPTAAVSRLTAALARQPGPVRDLRVVGSTLDDLEAMTRPGVFVTGPVQPDNLGVVLARLAPAALLLPYRSGLFHLLEAARAAEGCPAAFFDWSGGSYVGESCDLVLAPALGDDEAAARIISWLDALAASSHRQPSP